jgi:c(7)-type cytochrome triheme protein
MKRAFAALAIIVLGSAAARSGELPFRLPAHPAPEYFGDVLIRRATANCVAKPVAFSHWRHRIRYTCRVCHLELDFAFKKNATEITEEANRKGAYCGACHNGKIAFGHTAEHCGKCHTGALTTAGDDLKKLNDLPWSRYGNAVDWTRAIESGAIKPRPTLGDGYEPLAPGSTLTLEADWNFVAPAIFPHAQHVNWLDCANCHPSIFNVKKKTTKHFSMKYNLDGDFCGACHLRVAFPLDDCLRCHPTMKNPPEL